MIFLASSIPAPQQGSGTGGPHMGVCRSGRESPVGPIRRHSARRSSALPTGQQTDRGIGQEDPGAWNQLPADGECAALPGGHQEVRRPRRGDLPDR